jgi:hypothetical protein
MAIGTRSPETSSGQGKNDAFDSQIIEYDRYIDGQLHRTRKQVKGVDLASSVMLLAVGSLVYLMVLALVDHWVVKGGLSNGGRIAAFVVLAVGVAAFVLFRLLPLALRRVNPVFAAYTIERHRPGLKNSLINFLLLRSGSDRLPERIYEAMEVQAANALHTAHAEVAVDRTPLIRLLLALVAVVFFVAIYALFSPKNPLTSFRRVMSPWADVAPPTRVMIRDIQPGNASGFHDQHVAVSAQIDGERPDEPITLRYSTVDGQVVGRAVPMTKAGNAYRHSAELPPDNLGLQQDLEYWIEAGDAFSPHYKIKVDTAPTITVEEIEYQYPDYAELAPRKVDRHGDIQALAGTRITLRAKANQVIRQANLDFECDGRNDLDMQVEGTKATVSFPLVWNDNLRRGEHESYQLRFRNEDGHENPKPIRYSIEVIRDLPPEVEFVEPELDPAKDLVVPPGKPVRFTVQAGDPDFKLAVVKFHARRDRTPLVDDSLLAESRSGQFHRDYLLDLKRLEVKPGEQIEFWAAADDNREPTANHSETPHYRLRIASPDDKENAQNKENTGQPDQNRQPKPGDNKKNESGKRNGHDEQEGDEGQPGEQQQSDQTKPGGKSKNGKKNERQQDQGQQSGDQQSSQGGHGDQSNANDKPQSGESNSSKNQSDGDNSGSGGDQDRQQQQDQKGGAGSDESQRLDPERDAGKAIDEINKFYNNKEKNAGEQNADQQQQAGKKQSGDKSEKPDSGQQGDDSQQGDQSNKQQPSKTRGKPNEKQSSGQQPDKGTDDPNQSGQPGKKQSDKQQGGKSAGDQGDSQQDENQPDKNKSDGLKGKKGDKAKPNENGQLDDQRNGQQEGSGQQAGSSDKGDQTKGDKPNAKPTRQPSKGEKGATGNEQGTPNESGDKSEKDKSGGGKQGDTKVGDEQVKRADGETKPREGQGGQAKGKGERDEKVKKHDGESPDQKGGDPESKDKGEGGAGDNEDANQHGSPTAQGEKQERKKQEISPDNKGKTSEDKPEMSGRSERQSDSQSGQEGDRDGEGKSGGGQRSNSEGTGSAGQNSEADQGGGKGETKGKGAAGEQGGDQQKANQPTGGKSSGKKGQGSNQGQGDKSESGQPSESPDTADPRGDNNTSNQPGQTNANNDKDTEKQPPTRRPQDKGDKRQTDGAPQHGAKNQSPDGASTPSDRGGHDVSGKQQRANPTVGGEPGAEETTPPDEVDNSEPGGDDPNQEYARKATDLALQRLQDQLAKDKPDPALLDKLGWKREDMERFYQQWNKLRKSADEVGPKGDAARQELDDALRSLGLRPRGSSLSGEGKRDDRVQKMRDSRRIPPPPEYQDQYREFNKARAKGSK